MKLHLDGWKTNISIVAAVGIAVYGKYGQLLSTQEMNYFLGTAAMIYAGGRRAQRNGSNYQGQNLSYGTQSISFAAIVFAVMGYYMDWHDYLTMGYEVVASMGYVGLEHKMQKVEQGSLEGRTDEELQEEIHNRSYQRDDHESGDGLFEGEETNY